MLPLRISLVQRGRHEDNGPRRLIAPDRPQMFEDVLQRMIEHADRNHYDVGLVMEGGQVLRRVVTGLVQAARVEERDEGSFLGGKIVLAREARTWLEALADLGVLGAGQILDDAGLAALRLAEEPEDGHSRLAAQLAEALVQLLVARRRGEPAFDRLEHTVSF